jgi:hypothetical protein
MRGLAAVGLMLTIWAAASALSGLHTSLGPPSQVVNVRWAPDAPADDRQRAEAELGLIAEGSSSDDAGSTRSYRLSRRAPDDIGRIVSHPLVSDTHHIDRRGLRVELDRPGMNPWLRSLLETDRTPLVSWGLVVFGLLPLWWARRGLPLLAAGAEHVFGGAVGKTARIGRTEIVGAVALAAAFLLPLLMFGPFDDEEIGLGIFSSQVYYRALFDGRWPFWLDTLGFGTPMPIGQRLDFHPVFALGNLMSVRVALSGVWVTHVALMVVYFLRLAAESGVRPPVRMILLACYLFSAPSLCHFYASDWVSTIVAWSLYPALVYYVKRVVLGEAHTGFWKASLRLGLLIGFWILNSHPGYLAPLAFGLAIYVAASTPSVRAWACLGLASVCAAAMGAERIYFTVTEMARFPATVPRVTQQGYALHDHAAAALVPLSSFDADIRLPFIGLVAGVLALAAIPLFVRGRVVHARACVVTFAATGLLSLSPDELMAPLRVLSGIWYFRDAMVLFGLLSAGMVLQRAVDVIAGGWATAVRLLATLQLAQQGALVWVAGGNVVAFRDHLQFYRHQGRPAGLATVLADDARAHGSRLYVSEDVRNRLRGRLSADGIHVITDLSLLGLDPINGWFKNISMDALYPSSILMHGLIGGQREVIENRALADVLGINLVMTTDADGVEPPGMSRLETYEPASKDRRLLVYANPDAWPKAVLTAADARHLRLPLVAGCPHTGALCRNYDAFAATRQPEPVRLDGRDGAYTARFAPGARERLLFLSTLFRPEFAARTQGRPLRVDSVAGGFLGITVPGGVSEVHIAFEPKARIVLSWFSGASLASLLTACLIVSWRERRA